MPKGVQIQGALVWVFETELLLLNFNQRREESMQFLHSKSNLLSVGTGRPHMVDLVGFHKQCETTCLMILSPIRGKSHRRCHVQMLECACLGQSNTVCLSMTAQRKGISPGRRTTSPTIQTKGNTSLCAWLSFLLFIGK